MYLNEVFERGNREVGVSRFRKPKELHEDVSALYTYHQEPIPTRACKQSTE
jgi:hypothetical protein